MSFARNIIRDLVEKRLWPVALLMVVAIVAIPMIGGGGSSPEAGEDAATIAPGPAVNTSSAVELLGPPSVRKRPGKVVDPFRRNKKADPAAETTAKSAEPAANAGSGGGTPAEPKAVAPKPPLSVYRTTVRFSPYGDQSKAKRISRLTPLGDLLNPAALFMGVTKGGDQALFLLSADATSVGEAGCKGTACRVIALSPGETQIIDLKPKGVEPTQFELELVKVKREWFGTAAKAAGARAYVHPDGADVLRLLIEDEATRTALTGFGYNRDQGIVVQVGTR